MAGNGKNIFAKIFTLFLIKGGDPCVGSQERFPPLIANTRAVFVPRR